MQVHLGRSRLTGYGSHASGRLPGYSNGCRSRLGGQPTWHILRMYSACRDPYGRRWGGLRSRPLVRTIALLDTLVRRRS